MTFPRVTRQYKSFFGSRGEFMLGKPDSMRVPVGTYISYAYVSTVKCPALIKQIRRAHVTGKLLAQTPLSI